MNRYFASAILGIASVSVFASEFNAEQQQLIERIKACNDAWATSIAQRSYAVFESACPQQRDALFWYTDAPDAPPIPYGGASGLWQYMSGGQSKAWWNAYTPDAVTIAGDTALVFYSIVWTIERRDGTQSEPSASRRVTVFRRSGDDWIMVGGSVAPDPTTSSTAESATRTQRD